MSGDCDPKPGNTRAVVAMYDCFGRDPNEHQWDSPVYDGATRCKHGIASCEECGTSRRRDARHTTVNGRGKVGEAIRRSKSALLFPKPDGA